MEVVGSGLGDDVHLRAKREAALCAIAAIGKVDLLDAVHACPRDARPFRYFSFKKAVDVAAVRGLAVESDVQSGKNVLQPVDAALAVRRGADGSWRDLEKRAHVSAIDRQVADLEGVQGGA